MRTFEEIDTLRAQHGLTRKAVYSRAGVHSETWGRTARGDTTPNVETLKRLSDALDALLAERRTAA